MTDAGVDPWKPLLAAGKAAFILGVFSLLRLGSEFLQLLMFGITKVEGLYLLIVALDVPVALLWLQCGRKLRARSPALTLLVAVAAIALADSLVSAVTLGPRMVGRLMDGAPGLRTGVFGARLLLYATEIIVAPIVLAVGLRNYDPVALAAPVPARSRLWGVFALATVATVLVQVAVKWALARHR